MGTTDLDVAYVARLARLNLSADEIEVFQKQLEQMLAHADKLREVDAGSADVSEAAPPFFNVFREDEPRGWFTAEEALKNAPRQADGLFVVPKVVE